MIAVRCKGIDLGLTTFEDRYGVSEIRIISARGGSTGLDPQIRTGYLTGNFRGFAADSAFWRQFLQSFQSVVGKFPEHPRKPGICSQFQCVKPQFPEKAGTGIFFAGTVNFS